MPAIRERVDPREAFDAYVPTDEDWAEYVRYLDGSLFDEANIELMEVANAGQPEVNPIETRMSCLFGEQYNVVVV